MVQCRVGFLFWIPTNMNWPFSSVSYNLLISVTNLWTQMFLSFKFFLLISMILNLNCFYSISVKKRNSHGHFKCIKKYKLIPRSYCLSAIVLLSYFFMLNSNTGTTVISRGLHDCSNLSYHKVTVVSKLRHKWQVR